MIDEMAPGRSLGSVDPGWEHGIAQDERKKKVKCNYCGKIVSGGIYRLKQHLARISGEVTYCNEAPEEVYKKMEENLEGHRASRRQRQSEEEAQASFDVLSNEDEEEEEEPGDYKQEDKLAICDKRMVVSMPPLRSLGFVDPGWEHGIAQDDRKKKVKCNYCGKVVSGGINRFKQHLARIPGEVAYCKMAPEEVYLKMKENMKWHRTGRRQRSQPKEFSSFHTNSDNENGIGNNNLANDKIKEKEVNFDKSIVPWNKTGRKKFRMISPGSGISASETQTKQPKLDFPIIRAHKQTRKNLNDKKGHKEMLSAICKFFCHAGIPFVAANSTYFHKMLDLVSQHGQGLRSPYSQLISGRFLQDEVASIKESLVEFKTSWMVTGCTIMADSWKDVQGRTLINFLVSCPRGVNFISSADASEMVQDGTKLFKLLDKIVDEVGEENVVQVVTENTDNYRTAGKMLEEKRQNLFWTPCAAFCIDRMLEDFLNIKWVGDCLIKGQKIVKFIYNRTWLLNLMKNEFTSGQEILQPAVTRFASGFTTMHNLIDHRSALKRMFQSNDWISSRFSKIDEGKEVEKIVLNSTFWKKMQYIRKSVDPVLQVLLKLDSEKGLSMPTVFNDMYRAKLAIKEILGDEVRRYNPFWNVIDNHWNSLFHHPLYLSAYFLNPSYRYRPDFLALPEVIRGLNECIVRLESDSGRRISASMQISDFVSAKADFGTELALSTRTLLDPAAWWQQHGINCLELQRIAIRVLSQSSSSFVSEQKWSTFDQSRSIRRNHLAQKHLSDVRYVHYNLRLKERQSRRKTDEFVSLDSAFLENLLGDWMIETKKPTVLENEDVIYNEMEQAETYESQMKVNDDLDIEGRKEPTDATSLPEAVEPVEVLPGTVAAAADNDDADLDVLGDDMSE